MCANLIITLKTVENYLVFGNIEGPKTNHNITGQDQVQRLNSIRFSWKHLHHHNVIID